MSRARRGIQMKKTKFYHGRFSMAALLVVLLGSVLAALLFAGMAWGKVLPGFVNPRWISSISSNVFKTVAGSDVYDLTKEKILPLTSQSHIIAAQSPGYSLNNVVNPVCYITGQPSTFMGIKTDQGLVQRLKRMPEMASAQMIWKFLDNQVRVGKLPLDSLQVAGINENSDIKGITSGIHTLINHRAFRQMPVNEKIAFLDELQRTIQTVREQYTALWEVTDPASVPDEFATLRDAWGEEASNYSNEQIIASTREAGFSLWNDITELQKDVETNLDQLSLQDAKLYITGVDYERFPSVSTYVSLVDALNRPLDNNMGNAAFQIWDGDRRALIVETMRMDNPHINANSHVVLVIDSSGSMDGEPIRQAKEAAEAYLNMSGSAETFSILKFSSQTDVLIESSQNKEKLNAAIESIQTGDQTALYDALVKGFGLLGDAEGRKAVLVLSDGANNAGTHSLGDVMDIATKAGVSVYSIAVGASAEHQNLARLSEQTGGRCYYTADTEALQDIYMEINKMFTNQYKINYIVSDRENKMRDLKIKLRVGGKTITAATTYMPDMYLAGSGWTR